MGVWYAIRYRAPRTGAAIAIAGRLGRARRDARRRAPLRAGRGLRVREPLRLAVARRARPLATWPRCCLPLGLLPLAAPLALLPALPELGLNLLSSTITQTSVKTHYAATAIPALLAAAVYGVARVGERAGVRRRAGSACRRRSRSGRSAASTSTRGRTSSGPARARRRPRRCPRQRDERARRASLRPPADLQLPGAPRGRMGGRRHATAHLPRQPPAAGGRARRSRHCGATRTGGSSSPRTACSSSGGARRGIACGSRYAQKPSEISCARRSSSAAASGTAQIAYHGVSQGVVASSRQPASPSLTRPRAASRAEPDETRPRAPQP